MKLSEQWLRACLPGSANLSLADLESALVGLGLELDDCQPDEIDPSDQIFTIKTPANRGDCLCVMGIARELAVPLGLSLLMDQPTEPLALLPETRSFGPWQCTEPALCPRYDLLWLSGIQTDSRLPRWLTERLRKSGIRSISPVVDILNYVMLELGQPMHAFDRQTLQGLGQIRLAKAGESIQLLGEKSVQLSDKMLVIADEQGPQAIAGVMGGALSAVTTNTSEIYLECAYFDPICIRHTAQALHLRTESAQRFERGIDPHGLEAALSRTLSLLAAFTGAQLKGWQSLQEAAYLPQHQCWSFRPALLPKCLAYDLAPERCQQHFEHLGFQVDRQQAEIWQVTVPARRHDIQGERDLLEELARLEGLDRIPSVMPSLPLQAAVLGTGTGSFEVLAKQILVSRAYQEVITYSFIDPSLYRCCHEAEPEWTLLNPISSEMSVMRASLIPGLLSTLSDHQRRYSDGLALFEWGLCFRGAGENLQQNTHLALLLEGSAWKSQWGCSSKMLKRDFFSLKADLEALCQSLLGRGQLLCQPAAVAWGHPAYSTALFWQTEQGQQALGYLSLLHPRIQKTLSLLGEIFLCELDISAFPLPLPNIFCTFSKFPAVKRDLALLLADQVPAVALQETILTLKPEAGWHLKQTVFDVYQGKGIPEGQKSVGISLVLQHQDRTLTEAEVETWMAKVLAVLGERYGAVLRQ